MILFKLCFYVPETHVEVVKAAVFDAGAGHIGNYDRCAWQILGQGQFRPLESSEPFLGEHGEVEVVPEYRVEMVCAETVIPAVLAALKLSHPYEEPAYDVTRLESFDTNNAQH